MAREFSNYDEAYAFIIETDQKITNNTIKIDDLEVLLKDHAAAVAFCKQRLEGIKTLLNEHSQVQGE